MQSTIPLYGFGGGGRAETGAKLTVTAPAGATVTVSKDGKSKTKVAGEDGVAVFQGLESGTWTVTASNGSQTAQTTVAINADYSTVIAFFAATINISYPAGSTCTATDGETTLTAPDVSGTWACVVPNTGTWTITCTNGSESASSSVSITADGQTKSVTLSYKPTASITAASGVTYTSGISGLDAETVSLFSEAISNNSGITETTSIVYIDYGEIHRKISVGDQVTLTLNGTSYAFDIIGFNHDTLTNGAAYGSATATGKAGITFQMHNMFDTAYVMNSSRTNSGGWKNSDMRTSTMVTMKGYLPSTWQSVIKPVNKASGTGSGSSSGTETVSDSCFLLSSIEIYGKATNSVSGEGSQYAYYKAGNSVEKSGPSDSWWTRSPTSGASTSFRLAVSSSNETGTYANNKCGVAFAFCV